MLNVDKGYVYRIDDFIWIDGAIEAIKLAKSLGFLTIVVTNQSGIARGLYTIEDMNQLHQWMNYELEKSGTGIDKYYYCPYHDQGLFQNLSFQIIQIESQIQECYCEQLMNSLLRETIAF